MNAFSCFLSKFVVVIAIVTFFVSAIVVVESFSTATFTTKTTTTSRITTTTTTATQLSLIPEQQQPRQQQQQPQCQRLRRGGGDSSRVSNKLSATLVADPEVHQQQTQQQQQQQQQQDAQIEEELRLLSTAASHYNCKTRRNDSTNDEDNEEEDDLLSSLLSATAQPVTQRPDSSKRRIKISSSSSKTKRPAAGLTREEEVQLSFQVRTYRAAIRLRKQVLATASNSSVYFDDSLTDTDDNAEETENAWAAACGISVHDLRRIVQEGQQARSALVAANVGLVTSIAKKHWNTLKHSTAGAVSIGTGMTMQDLVQEGNLGLIAAAERFDPARNVRFGTYATWWVRQRISKSLVDGSRMIRLPAHVVDKLTKIQRAAADMKAHTGREPDLQELARTLEMPVGKLKKLTDCRRPTVSLELPLSKRKGDDRERTLGDTLASTAPTPMDDAELVSLRAAVQDCLDSELTETERDVLTHRFGLKTGSPLRLQETADLLGVSRDRVRLLETRALNKLRSPQRNYKLKQYMGDSSDKNVVGGAGASGGIAFDYFGASGGSELACYANEPHHQEKKQPQRHLDSAASTPSGEELSTKLERQWFF